MLWKGVASLQGAFVGAGPAVGPSQPGIGVHEVGAPEQCACPGSPCARAASGRGCVRVPAGRCSRTVRAEARAAGSGTPGAPALQAPVSAGSGARLVGAGAGKERRARRSERPDRAVRAGVSVRDRRRRGLSARTPRGAQGLVPAARCSGVLDRAGRAAAPGLFEGAQPNPGFCSGSCGRRWVRSLPWPGPRSRVGVLRGWPAGGGGRALRWGTRRSRHHRKLCSTNFVRVVSVGTGRGGCPETDTLALPGSGPQDLGLPDLAGDLGPQD